LTSEKKISVCVMQCVKKKFASLKVFLSEKKRIKLSVYVQRERIKTHLFRIRGEREKDRQGKREERRREREKEREKEHHL